MSYRDVREWIEKVGEMGELKVIEGADWNLEIGALSVLASKHRENSPALLFDRIKDYPAGYRILVGFFESLKRSALTTNLSLDITREGFIQAWRERLAKPASIPPVTVARGPVLENIFVGDEIDLFKFPVPRWHERDGGRYIGTGHVVITRDPEEGWVNVGCYRVMVHDRNTMGMNISPGKHGRMHRQKYFDKGKPCPVVACFGVDPLLHMVATRPEPYGRSEFDAVSGIKGEPVEVIIGEFTGLPIPAYAEIAIEGIPAGSRKGRRAVQRVDRLLRQRREARTADKSSSLVPSQRSYHHSLAGIPADGARGTLLSLLRAYIRDQVEKAGVPDVKAVASYFRRFLTVISIRQRYPGHARQAGLVASQCQGAAYLGRYVVVVDDDINAYDINDVLWAMCSRADPVDSAEILRRCWSGPLDPIIPRERKGFSSRMILDACRPFEWRDKFPPAAEISAERQQAVMQKWKKELFS
jgi:4-hydroxy-3-polyprenylbenzoate decarboxylase